MASGSDMTSDFESITSSNYAFREEGGRRYPPKQILEEPPCRRKIVLGHVGGREWADAG